MSRMIKICGITRLEDALDSVRWGANALGFNFYPKSPRYIEPAAAAAIIERLPEGVLTVGVFVRQVDAEAAALVQAVQIHGLERPEEVPQLPQRVLVATSPERAPLFDGCEIVIDTSWGSGRLADWDAVGRLGRPYILSGGLDPGNISLALERLRPAGVDVCSGVEASPGIKDPAKLRAFLKKVTES